MKKISSGVFYGLIILFLLTLIIPVSAQDVPKFEVILNSTADQISGIEEVWSVNDPAQYTGLILLIKVGEIKAAKVWAADFSVSYNRNGQEDIAKCLGLGLTGAGKLEIQTNGLWLFGDYVNMAVKEGTYFQALFGIEKDVTEVTLQYKEPVTSVIINKLSNTTY